MDLISEVISSAGEVELSELSNKINDYKLKVINSKETLKNYLETRYVEKIPLMKNKNLQFIIQNLVPLGQEINSDIEVQMKKHTSSLKTELEESYDKVLKLVATTSFLQLTSDIDLIFHDIREELNSELLLANYLSIAQNLAKVKTLMDKMKREAEFVQIFCSFGQKFCQFSANALTASEMNWERCLSLKVVDVDKKGKFVTISLTSTEDLKLIFKTLVLLSSHEQPVENFSTFLLKEVMKPIICYKSTISIAESDSSVTLTLEYKLKSPKNNFETVMNDIFCLFTFLNNYLDLPGDEIINFSSLLGENICDDFLKLFIEEQVVDKMPLTKNLLPSYAKVVEQLITLQYQLVDKGFCAQENQLLKEYCGNIEEQFKNKLSSRYLEVAKTLMKKDLHDMMPVGPIPYDEASENNSLETSFYLEDEKHKYIFPKCQISKSVKDLVSLVRECLTEATTSDYSLSLTLINTARRIITVYTTLVVKHHRELLDKIPQQSALVYNNGMYLALSVLQLEKQLQPQSSKDNNLQQASLSDLIGQLNNMSHEELNRQLSLQNSILKDVLGNSGLEKLSELEFFPQSIEKSIRQCLRQLMLLQNVWKEVLPIDIYNKIIGMLCNTFIDELVVLIVTASDIREEIANQLVLTIGIISDKAPQVFSDPREIHKWVKSWMKLDEVRRVLGGSLVDISERWAAGNGPLAVAFNPEQVRNMVKALFQNSEHRSRLLASIN